MITFDYVRKVNALDRCSRSGAYRQKHRLPSLLIIWTVQLCQICSNTQCKPCLCLISATCEPVCLVLCCKPVIVLGQLPKDVLKAHHHTQTHCSKIPPPPPPWWGAGQERTACVPSRRPKFHDFPRIPVPGQVVYSVVIHKDLMKAHE